MSTPRATQIAGKSSEEIRAEVRRIQDQEDTWKVYRKEWIPIAFGTREEAEDAYAKNYDGRVHDEDCRIAEDRYMPGKHFLELRLWNVKGEFKHKHLAEEHAQLWPDEDIRIVSRNGRDEQALKDYSKKKLKTGVAAAKRPDTD